MQPLAIVKHLDKLKDVALRLVTGVKRAVMHQLILQRAKEALSHGVVVAVPAATHAGDQAMLGQDLPIARRGILTTRSEEHTSELQSQSNLVCRLLLEKKKTQ